MLMINRREDESFFVGNNCRITIVRVYGGKVAIGVEAPREVEVNRSEILPRDRLAEYTRNAAQPHEAE